MNHFVAGIIRIILLEASVALLIMERAIDEAAVRLRARRRWGAYLVAALSVSAFLNFGELHGDGNLVHPWEQYHFFLGSKYLREVGYFDLYTATILADREGTHRLDRVSRTRDLRTFDEVDVDRALADAATVRARFSDARWEEFKADWASLSRWPAPWNAIVADHGNSGSPAWAVAALPFVELFGASPTGQTLLGCLDLVLMAVMFVFLFRAFGGEAAAVGLIVWSLTPFSFDFLAGSILRWDWLFAVGMAFACWRRERPLLAGACLGYAAAAKLFPLFFAVALGVWLVIDSFRRRRLDPQLPRFVAGFAAAAIALVLASSAAFGGFGVWRAYRDRIEVTQTEKYYANQYSLKTVFLQVAESTPHELSRTLLKPAVIKQSLPRVDIDSHRVAFLLVQLALTALALVAVARAGAVEALAAGPFLVFIWLTVNAYYWNMLGLTALAWAAAQLAPRGRLSLPLLALHVTWGAFYLYQHLNMGFAEGYFVALLLLGTFVVWAASAIAGRRPAAC
ncbi:MAG TPA: glycosyltransferase family 87 protein [Haliangiales bacterium]|nr:glycosyltransferase family 87 protein [Haliangiales bacterium]